MALARRIRLINRIVHEIEPEKFSGSFGVGLVIGEGFRFLFGKALQGAHGWPRYDLKFDERQYHVYVGSALQLSVDR